MTEENFHCCPDSETKNRRTTYYVASSTRHANLWKMLRASGINILSTWIDEIEVRCPICGWEGNRMEACDNGINNPSLCPECLNQRDANEEVEHLPQDGSDLSRRCLGEAVRADVTVLYATESDVLKGAFIEVGAALAAGKQVISVGRQFSRVFEQHPNWKTAASLDEAFACKQ
jgi:hypothetical protein